MGAAPRVAAGARAGASPRQRVAGGRQEVQGAHDGEARVLAVPLLSSSGLELGLLEEVEAGPASGSENTSTAGGALEWPGKAAAGPGSAPRPAAPAILGDQDEVVHACRSRRIRALAGPAKGLQAGGGAVRGRWASPGSFPAARGVLPAW